MSKYYFKKELKDYRSASGVLIHEVNKGHLKFEFTNLSYNNVNGIYQNSGTFLNLSVSFSTTSFNVLLDQDDLVSTEAIKSYDADDCLELIDKHLPLSEFAWYIMAAFQKGEENGKKVLRKQLRELLGIRN